MQVTPLSRREHIMAISLTMNSPRAYRALTFLQRPIAPIIARTNLMRGQPVVCRSNTARINGHLSALASSTTTHTPPTSDVSPRLAPLRRGGACSVRMRRGARTMSPTHLILGLVQFPGTQTQNRNSWGALPIQARAIFHTDQKPSTVLKSASSIVQDSNMDWLAIRMVISASVVTPMVLMERPPTVTSSVLMMSSAVEAMRTISTQLDG